MAGLGAGERNLTEGSRKSLGVPVVWAGCWDKEGILRVAPSGDSLVVQWLRFYVPSAGGQELGGLVVKSLPVNAGDAGNMGSIPALGRSPGVGPWSRKWQLTPIFFHGESHGQRSLVGYSPLGCKELDTTE